MNSQFKHRLKRATSRQSLNPLNILKEHPDSDLDHQDEDRDRDGSPPARFLFPSPARTSTSSTVVASSSSVFDAASSSASTSSSSSKSNTTLGDAFGGATSKTSRPPSANSSGPSSPRKRKRPSISSTVVADRFIPSTSTDLRDAYTIFGGGPAEGVGGVGSAFGAGPSTPRSSKSNKSKVWIDIDPQQEQANTTFTQALSSELFPAPPSAASSSLPFASPVRSPARPSSTTTTSTATNGTFTTTTTTTSSPHQHVVHHTTSSPHRAPETPTRARLLNFASPSRKSGALGGSIFGSGGFPLNASLGLASPRHEVYNTSPIREGTRRVLLSPRRSARPVPKQPFKVLDAPDLTDDFYLNLVDWSSTNVLAVGLGTCAYLWAANTSKVVKLCDLTDDSITGLSWERKGSTLAIGTQSGVVHIYDAEASRLVRTFQGHGHRVGALSWALSSANAAATGSASHYGSPMTATLSSGSRDRTILHRDLRAPDDYFQRLNGHRQEICGLKWNQEGTHLASGGNDNKLLVWDAAWTGRSTGGTAFEDRDRSDEQKPLWKFHEHQAAVKAIAWSPHTSGLLASGGGTADKTIRSWNVSTGQLVNWLDTGSQVCNLTWSKSTNEIVSTHGYSSSKAQHQVCIWRYPSMNTTATLSGHTHRVLYLAMSPDGETIVTGAGDETLRFWHAFPKVKPAQKQNGIVDYLGREETIR